MPTRHMHDFSDEELDTLELAGRILAGKRISINLRLQTLHPESHSSYLVKKARNKIDKALQNYPNWREVNTELKGA